MKKGLTEIVFLLDRSGSMAGLASDTIGGFNAMIEKQKKADGTALVSTVLFDSASKVIHDRVNVQDVRPLTTDDYTVRGCTALLVPEHTLFVITTDGMENASRRYGIAHVRQMIEKEKAKYGWEFLFLGANIDAVETANAFGIDASRAANYCCDSAGTALNYDVIGEAISAVRSSRPLNGDWKRRIDADYAHRGRSND